MSADNASGGPTDPLDPEIVDVSPRTFTQFGAWVHHQFGRRGGALLILAAMDLVYGAALITAHLGASELSATSAKWWPASLGTLFDIPTSTWGWIWIGTGLLLVSGAPRRYFDRWQIAASVTLKFVWAGASLAYWYSHRSAGLWGLFAIYCGLAGLALIISGWRDSCDIIVYRKPRRRPDANDGGRG